MGERQFVYIFLISSLLFEWSCTNQGSVLSNTDDIEAQPLSFSGLDPFSTRISHVADDTLFFVDEAGGSLSKFSLMDQSLSQVELKLVGDFRPSMLHYISADSILFYDGARLLLYRDGGADQQTFSLFEGLSELEEEVYAEYPYERIANSLVYLPNQKSVLFYFAKADASKKRIFAGYSLETKSWTSFPVYHPGEFDGVALDNTTFPSVAVGQSGFAFIYSISPTISSYSFETAEQLEFPISSFEGKQSAEPQTMRDSWDQAYFQNWVLTSPNYLKLLYDPYRKVYYRVSQEALEKEVPLGEDYYTFLLRNRQLYLTVLNEKLEVLGNYPLEKGKYDPSNAFVFSQGLWIPYASELMEKEAVSGEVFSLEQ
ncbi:DUF4221 family protein [Algoriphagus sp. AK58]|uniref:DUF4221 family protein n=1 Tax=Algoriphagus sp. AK58 TaxID=1406877 RepID=UPI0016500971|nr:DUF4221 family protein [Algoriphagus sp. AK58]MBC6367047.1 hypothetical protein [Algoriphagus sp. AK58]